MNNEMNIRLAEEGKRVIVVLQRGWVFTGKYSQDEYIGTLKDAACIRRWGTSQGLGELAEQGPRTENDTNGPTIFDPSPDITFHIREVVFVMNTNEANWPVNSY